MVKKETKRPVAVTLFTIWLFLFGAYVAIASPILGLVFWILSFFVFSLSKKGLYATLGLSIVLTITWIGASIFLYNSFEALTFAVILGILGIVPTFYIKVKYLKFFS